MSQHWDYKVDEEFAEVQVSRGLAEYAAKFYLRKLRALGVDGIRLATCHEGSVAKSAKDIKLKVL